MKPLGVIAVLTPFSSKSTFSYRAPVQQVGCVAKTHRDAERCVIASSTAPYRLTPSAPARPLPGTKAIRRAHFRLGHRAPGRGGRRARTVSGCVNSAFLNISIHLRFICSVHGYPTQRAANTSRSRSDRFGLLELRVSRTFLDQLRPKDGAGQVSTATPCPAFLYAACQSEGLEADSGVRRLPPSRPRWHGQESPSRCSRNRRGGFRR